MGKQNQIPEYLRDPVFLDKTDETNPDRRIRPEYLLAQAGTQQGPVGQAPPEREQAVPEVQAIADIGGVLTPRGKLILEPSLQFSNSQVNQFTFVGVEIVVPSILIGLLEAVDTDRDLFSAGLTARYGITSRLEAEAKVSYLYRDDRVRAIVPQTDQELILDDLTGDGIGDAEFTLHYQINRGQGGWPFFIGNLRYKSNTGKGPFDVDRDAQGEETELPTGSGFHAVEPSVTILYPSDPAVFFVNLGYVFNISDNVNETFLARDPEAEDPDAEPANRVTVGEVDPGDVFRVSFGMAYSINERTSFTLGYKHDFIEETDTEFLTEELATGIITRTQVSSSTLDVGALLLGFGLRINERIAANLNIELGITDDAPDVALTLRVPYSF